MKQTQLLINLWIFFFFYSNAFPFFVLCFRILALHDHGKTRILILIWISDEIFAFSTSMSIEIWILNRILILCRILNVILIEI